MCAKSTHNLGATRNHKPIEERKKENNYAKAELCGEERERKFIMKHTHYTQTNNAIKEQTSFLM